MKNRIISFCNDLGLDTIGFVKCRKFKELIELYTYRKNKNLENEFEETDIEKRINPFIYMENGKTIISIAFPYMKNFDLNDEIYFSKYTQVMDYHKVVRLYLDKICKFIQSLGGEAIPLVDSNSLPERHIAALGGVGFIGKNNMVITKKYGSYVFLGEIITSLNIQCENNINLDEILSFKKCNECHRCYEKCPTKSINIHNKNCNICLSYITQKKEIDDKWLDKLNGRLFGCDTCQTVCPYNKYIEKSLINEFKTMDFMKNINIEEIIYMDKKTFKEKYIKTSCGWRGKSILQRNALIACLTLNGNYYIDDKKILSPYVKEYYNRLLNKGDL
ncbi:tRNA epoxyqueuosine(34) reductase QueG [Clostridium frigidicarnis]|uniref:Epoxyqueuosine reductase n=1 Tax=Clostridium frigidicarnis TaxID=84698 RepID=A0A1I1AIF2_9CLOT|nr:tRNA epoxyqueuosine(34) reductase QueG [Clostridium frigidicarnis]SFB36230.1 epoxyqueuosine reductase [Clostridium frigidicarnis]